MSAVFTDIRPHFGAEILCCDGVFIKQMPMPKLGDAIPQHSHKYDHHTLIARGSVRVFADGRRLGDFHEPQAVYIKAGTKHLFVALEDSTLAYCIHRLRDGEDEVQILAEHNFGD